MTKRKLYTLIAVLIIIGVYAYDFYFDKNVENEIVEEGKQPKLDTNEYFLPTSTTGQVVHHEGYSLSYSEPHEQAEWVAYELKKSHLSNTNFKRPYFEIDKSVKTKAAHWRSYKNSGYDRGHLCPAGDRKYSQFTHDETFLTSNISPQEHEFNSEKKSIPVKLSILSTETTNSYSGLLELRCGNKKANTLVFP